MLKDDKTYPYIKVTVSEEYPRILFSRMMKRIRINISDHLPVPGGEGHNRADTQDIPYQNLHEKASPGYRQKTGRLYYHIHQCDAPCQGYVSKEEYQQSVKQALDFLGGRYEPVMKYLEDRMTAASEEMEFEKRLNTGSFWQCPQGGPETEDNQPEHRRQGYYRHGQG